MKSKSKKTENSIPEKIKAEFCARFFAPRCTIKPSQWLPEHLQFDEPEIRGWFNFSGREYLREVVDDVIAEDISDFVYVFGTGVGKTISSIGRTIFSMINFPRRKLWVFPGSDGPGGAASFVKTRFLPCLQATKVTREKMPKGAKRFDVSASSIRMLGSVIDFVGSNSPAQIAANRCGEVEQDEVDKFAEVSEKEPSASYNADRRTDGVDGAKRFKSSSPSIDADDKIWHHFILTDQQRRFLPCPHCNSKAEKSPVEEFKPMRGWIILAWSDQYTCFKLRGDEAFVRWDQSAKQNGEWNFESVRRSAHFVCPWCKGKITDLHKIEMDKRGEWRPTTKGFPKHIGRHLPSLYSNSSECRVGELAVEFLKSQNSLSGVRGFINSRLAEVYVSQESGRGMINVTSEKITGEDLHVLMTCDFQKKHPFIWFLIQRWSSFKLLPPISTINGKPYFVEKFKERPDLELLCKKIVADHEPAWIALAEIVRFDTRTGNFPLLEFCAAKGITGEKLVKIWRDECGMDTMSLGRFIYKEMGQRMPKGGDSEVIAAGFVESSQGLEMWTELADIQREFKVGETFRKNGVHPNNAVSIDAGWQQENNPEVLRVCFMSGQTTCFCGQTLMREDGWEFPFHCPIHGFRGEWYDPRTRSSGPRKLHPFCQPVPVDNWWPYKGKGITVRKKITGITRETWFTFYDPFDGSADKDKYVVAALEAPSDLYFHRWMDLRDRQEEIQKSIAAGKNYRGYEWGLSKGFKLYPEGRFSMADFNTHMNARFRTADGEIKERGSGGGGKSRYPDHLNDCARNQFPLAEAHGIFSHEPQAEVDKKA